MAPLYVHKPSHSLSVPQIQSRKGDLGVDPRILMATDIPKAVDIAQEASWVSESDRECRYKDLRGPVV